MMKRIYITITIIFFCTFTQTIPQRPEPIPEYVIAFDLHGVVFNNNWTAIWQELKQTPCTLRSLLTLLNPAFIYSFLKLYNYSDSYEEIITKLVNQYPELTQYFPRILTLLNLQIPIAGTVDTIHELKNRGYTLYVFSNIGEQSLAHLQMQFPDIFESFSGCVYTQPEDNWIQKPHKAAYEKFLNRFNLRPEQVIFIDDKLVNIKTAREMGFNGIHFTSPEQLREALKAFISDRSLAPLVSF